MDAESWIQGYLAGVSLHNHLRTPQLRPSVVATMSATGITGELNWFADMSGVATLTMLSAEFTGDISASYSYNGTSYTNPAPLSELLRVNPRVLSSGVRGDTRRLWFRFYIAADANLKKFTLLGIPSKEAV